MAIDLQNPTNIATGWGRPPDFSAPNIGGMVGDILKVRLARQVDQEKQIADAIKQYQSQRSDAAYGQALQSSGVVPYGVDVSRISGPDLTKLAALYQETIPDTDLDKSRQAEAYYHNTLADAIKSGNYGGRGGRSGTGSTEVIYDEVNDPDHNFPIPVTRSSKVYQDFLRSQHSSFNPPSTPSGVNTTVKSYPGLTPNDIVDQRQHTGYKISPDGSKLMPLEPGDSYEDDATHVQIQPSTPGSPSVTVSKQELERMKRQVIGPSYDPRVPNAEPPADNPDPVLPNTPGAQRVRPNASTGAPVNTPQVGDTVGGYIFQGGDPNDRKNWIPAGT